MAPVASAGAITGKLVDDGWLRLLRLWAAGTRDRAKQHAPDLGDIMGMVAAAQLDVCDAMQLAGVIGVCLQSNSLSDAGRKLFGVSREAKSKPNDADRLKKYLARFGLDWERVS